MTKTEKAKEIVRQGGECYGVSCDTAKNHECVCLEWCKKINSSTICRRGCLEICEKYLKENAVGKNVFDKSKVLVAGLDEIEVGKRYYFSNFITSDSENNLKNYVESKLFAKVWRAEKLVDGRYVSDDGPYTFAYPYEEPVKTWRPIKTIEEAQFLKGKWLRSKTGKIEFCVMRIAYFDAGIYINDSIRADVLLEQYTFESGSPVGIEE